MPALLHYKRHGTTTLFAALEVASGKVIGRTYRKATRNPEAERPNYATHKHEKVLDWIEREEAHLPALHADERLVGKPGRAVLRDVDGKAAPARRLHLGASSREVPEGVPEELQRRSATVGVDEIVRRDHGESQTRPDRPGQYSLITILLRTLH